MSAITPDYRSLQQLLDEQTAIVRFLDHANRKIDGFIRAKRKLIGLLNEQKQAVILRADILALEQETEGLLHAITKGATA